MNSSKTVILIRHAKSSWAYPELTDFERPLNGRGQKAAPFMGQKLNNYGLDIDQFITSPSKRTTQTAKRICKEIANDFNKVEFDDSIYHGSMDDLLDIINAVDEQCSTIILLGHNPSITDLSNLLQKESYIANVPTCGMVSIIFAVDAWADIGEGKGTLSFYEYPKKYGL